MIQVSWENKEKTVLRYSYFKGWTLEDFYQAAQQAKTMLDSVVDPVVYIIDYRDGGTIPANIFSNFKHIVELTDRQNEEKYTYLLANSLVLTAAQRFFNMISHVAPNLANQSRWIIVENLEEAIELAQAKAAELKHRDVSPTA